MVTLSARPDAVDIDPRRTAIVVVDMQNAFAAKGGMFDLAGFDISRSGDIIATHQRLLPACRAAGVKVIYLAISFKPDLSDAGTPDTPAYHKELALRMMRARPDLTGKLLIDGSWDAAIVDDLKPQPGDRVIRKTRYSGFVRTELEDELRAADIRHLLFTGVATNVCVESTARDAFFKDFWPIMIEDAMSNSGPDFNQQATLWNFEHVLGWVTDSASVIAALQTTAASRTSVAAA
jgi:ureidoacrylate peracid hydrolase